MIKKPKRDANARWSVRMTGLGPVFTITGKYNQSFFIRGSSDQWKSYADMMRRAMRRLCPEREDRP